MKLCSIISVWSDCLELLPFCIENHLQFCDGVIVVWSASSNHFVKDDRMLQFVATHKYDRVLFHQLEPSRNLRPLINETRKRNQGIEVAKREGYSHFFIADADEFYLPSDVERDKKLFEQSEINGIVCRLKVYVGRPTLWCEDSTLVPFIHRLTPQIKCGRIHDYPFAYQNKVAVIDPSRRLSEVHRIIMSDTIMHHYSHVRKDIGMKFRNSTAKLSNRLATIKLDIQRAKPGYVTQFYGRPLQESPNYFDICI
jgi:hypothetical protein